jgi:bifunctional polynucleotide phosphatase/kinase
MDKPRKKIQIKVLSCPSSPFRLIRHKSIYYTQNDVVSHKFAVFDLDGTIITTLSGKRFAQSQDDWQLSFTQVIQVLRKYNDDGYKIIIVTNQHNVEIEMLSDKLANIQKLIQTPTEFYIAVEKDTHRKPMTDIWDFILQNNHITPTDVHPSTFYCGDAAGREKNYLRGKPADFNITDRYFSNNIGISFYTPEEIFLNTEPFTYVDPYHNEINLQEYYPTTSWPIPEQLLCSSKNLIIMVGPQASGKSTLSTMEPFKGYTHLNNDTIKNMSRLKKYFLDAVDNGKSIIVDNTNPSPDTRRFYIDYARQSQYTIYCYFFNFPKILTKHLNQLRAQITHNSTPAIPMVAIHTYYKNLVSPTQSEGISEIVTITTLHLPIINKTTFDRYYFYHYDLS